MAVLSIGRAFDGLDVEPMQQSFGDESRLSMTGQIAPASYEVLQAARDRILALTTNHREPVVPVTFTEDPSITGWYRVLSSGCQVFNHSPATAYGEWSVELERVGGTAAPQLELYGFHGVRVNPHSITNTDLTTGLGAGSALRIAVPGASVDFWRGAQSTAQTRTTDTGTVSLYTATTGAVTSTFTVAAADAYDGACHIRTTYGSTADLLVGGGYGANLFGDGWILSNGLIRVKRHASISTALAFEVYDGSQWEALAGGVGWRLEHDYGGGSNVQWDLDDAVVSVLQNSPEQCTIRLAMAGAAAVVQFGRVWLDITVRRGFRHVFCVARCDTMGILGGVMALEPTSSIAATTTDGGLRATSNDAASNRAVWGVAGSQAVTANTTTGRITQNAGNTVMPFFVGVEIGGSGASGMSAADFITYEAYDIRTEAQRVVRR